MKAMILSFILAKFGRAGRKVKVVEEGFVLFFLDVFGVLASFQLPGGATASGTNLPVRDKYGGSVSGGPEAEISKFLSKIEETLTQKLQTAQNRVRTPWIWTRIGQ